MDKTQTTAAVVIPPESVWEPIQAIRRTWDRGVRRWMPHVTLVYPFRPHEEFDALAAGLCAACAAVEPFDVTLARFGWFDHGGESYTTWLAPEPAEPLARLQEAVWHVAPDCDDVRRFDGGYAPHLSVGQVRGRRAMEERIERLQNGWRPPAFRVDAVSLIWRGEPPDDVFRVGRTVPLGGALEGRRRGQ